MPSFRRARKNPRDRGMPRFQAGVLALVLIATFSYFGFTKANPFAHPYTLKAEFKTASNLRPNSPVRIAGVEVGKVKKVEPDTEKGGAKVTMELQKRGLPIHSDAQLKIRPRIFLEGNFFVDIQPGSPSGKTVDDGGTIPIQQTSAPVQFGDVLASLQSDTRADLRTLLTEYSLKGLGNGGAEAFNRSVKYWGRAYRGTAVTSDAALGIEPTKDIRRVLRGQQRTFAALDRQPEALKGLITNFNITAGAFAREDVALEASVPALRDVLRVGSPALRSVNDALPSLRAFAVEALPGVESSSPTLTAAIPFITQARKLVSRRELRGAARQLRRQIPSLVRLNRTTIPVLRQARALSSCTDHVLVPFANSRIPSSESGNDNQLVYQQLQRGFPGLSGESRLSDANNQRFHVSAAPVATRTQPAAPDDPTNNLPARRPDVPCETQDPPNLGASVGSGFSSRAHRSGAQPSGAMKKLVRLYKVQGTRQERLIEKAKKKQANRAGRR